jgi:SAM-dependent methyltransferase
MENNSFINDKLQRNFILDNGIWVNKNSYKLSYPESGNASCFQVEDDSFWFKHRNNIIAYLVKKYHKSGNFLDVGGGNGFVSNFLCQSEINSVLIEPGLKGCQNAKKRGVPNVINSSLEDLNFESDSIHSIGFFDVMEHIEDDEKFLSECYRILKTNGCIYFTVPACSSLWSYDDIFAGHFRRYNLKLINRKLESLGFSIVYQSYLFSYLYLPVLFIRRIPYLFVKKKILNTEQEHGSGGGMLNSFFKFLSKLEFSILKRGIFIPFGTSIIVVAKKTYL